MNKKVEDEVQEMINMLETARAGNYKPSLLGKTAGLFYPRTRLEPYTDALAAKLILDISFYQVTANFEQMKANGVDGTIIRAGQNLWEDSKAKTFMDGAKLAGMPFGSYWFFDSRVSPAKQAELWATILQGYDPELWIWADYEENYGGAWAGWDGFYQFLEACKAYMPNRKIGIYTGFYYWVEHSPNPITQSASLYYFAQYPLWLAWYTTDPTQVRIPKPWTEMTFWQYSASGDGYKYGVGSREVDMNKFMGDDFYATFGLNDDGNGGEEPMPEINWTGSVILGPAIVRATPGGADTGQRLQTGTAVTATGDLVPSGAYQWRNVVTPVVGWVADHLLDGEYTTPPTPEPGLPSVLYIGTKPDGSDLSKYNKEA